MLQTAKKIVRTKKPRKIRTPRDLDRRIEEGDMADHLEEIARKADLVAWALQGVMAHEASYALWPLQDAAYEIKDAIEAIAREVRS